MHFLCTFILRRLLKVEHGILFAWKTQALFSSQKELLAVASPAAGLGMGEAETLGNPCCKREGSQLGSLTAPT